MQDKIIFENENIDSHLLKAWRTPTIQTVTEHRTESTDWPCEYLNGYVTVQHRSFGKPSFLDPRSSIIETRDSILASWDSILASRNSKRSSFEKWGSSLEFRASSVNLLLSGTVGFRMFNMDLILTCDIYTVYHEMIGIKPDHCYFLSSAQRSAILNTSSVLYIPMVTPPVPVNSNTSVVSLPLPSAGAKEISKTPGPFITKSLARY